MLQFLKEVLTYLNDWKKSVTSRSGFEKQEQKKMMLSAETQYAIQILGENLELTVTILCSNLLCSLFFHHSFSRQKESLAFCLKNCPKSHWKSFLGARGRKEGPTTILWLVNF